MKDPLREAVLAMVVVVIEIAIESHRDYAMKHRGSLTNEERDSIYKRISSLEQACEILNPRK